MTMLGGPWVLGCVWGRDFRPVNVCASAPLAYTIINVCDEKDSATAVALGARHLLLRETFLEDVAATSL